jgi:polysaccharide export outer membrane protein
MLKRFGKVVAVALSFWAWACAADDAPAAPGKKNVSVIGVQDTVSINVLSSDEISKTWRVSATGELNLPLADTIKEAGMTVEELQQELVRRLKRYIIEPEVSVFVTEVRSRPVTVTGAVAKPGVYQIEGQKTLFDALVMAGGPLNAGTKVTLKRELAEGSLKTPGTRLGPDRSFAFADLELAEVMKGKGDAATLEIQAQDQISVSPAGPSKFVYISGEVQRPGSVELVTQDSVSLMKVLAVAGGLGPNANGKRALVMHVNAAGVQTSTSYLDLTQIQSGKAKDLELIAGDILVVPSSSLKNYAHQAGGSAVSIGMYSALYILARF